MVTEWVPACTARRHQHQGIPATDRYYHTVYGVQYLCAEHAIALGRTLHDQQYKWEPLPQPSEAQPISKGVNQ